MNMQRKLGIAAGVAFLTLVGGAFVPGNVSRESDALRQASAVLTSMGALPSACKTNCEYTGCSLNGHKNYNMAGGNDGGEVHSCAYGSSCSESHSCGDSFAAALTEFEALAGGLSGRDLFVLASRFERMTIEVDRRALQILTCEGQVGLTMELTPDQLKALSE